MGQISWIYSDLVNYFILVNLRITQELLVCHMKPWSFWVSFLFKVSNSVTIHSPVCVCVCTCVLSRVWLFVTPWTVACHDPLSMEFSRQGYWSELPCPSPGELPDPGIEPVSLMSRALAGGFFITSITWEALTKILFVFLKLISLSVWITMLRIFASTFQSHTLSIKCSLQIPIRFLFCFFFHQIFFTTRKHTSVKTHSKCKTKQNKKSRTGIWTPVIGCQISNSQSINHRVNFKPYVLEIIKLLKCQQEIRF